MRESPTSPFRTGEILEALYGAGSGELEWDEALGIVAADFGADFVAIFADRPASERPFACISNAPADVERVFASWSATARHLDLVRSELDRLPPRSILRSSDLLTPADYRASGFYRDYASRFGGTTFMDVDLYQRHDGTLNLCLWAQDRGTTFDDTSVDVLGHLVPHFTRSLRLDEFLQRERLRHDFALAALEALATPVFAIDARATVVFCNAAGQAFLDVDNGLKLTRGALDATGVQGTTLSARLRRLVGEPSRLPGIQTLTVSRAERHPLVLTVVTPPAATDLWSEAGAVHGALVFIGDPDRELAAVSRDLRHLHGLTEREAEVAIGIANGRDPTAIAEHEGVGVETVRKQLKQAFAKTGTSRQADLARLVLLELGNVRRDSSAA